jgi:hypothetical protein
MPFDSSRLGCVTNRSAESSLVEQFLTKEAELTERHQMSIETLVNDLPEIIRETGSPLSKKPLSSVKSNSVMEQNRLFKQQLELEKQIEV